MYNLKLFVQPGTAQFLLGIVFTGYHQETCHINTVDPSYCGPSPCSCDCVSEVARAIIKVSYEICDNSAKLHRSQTE